MLIVELKQWMSTVNVLDDLRWWKFHKGKYVSIVSAYLEYRGMSATFASTVSRDHSSQPHGRRNDYNTLDFRASEGHQNDFWGRDAFALKVAEQFDFLRQSRDCD